MVRFRPEAPKNADVAHLVERHLAKVEVAGSSPVIRSKALLKKQGSFFCLNAEKYSVYAAFWDCAF